MAQDSHQERKQQLIASLNSKRQEMSQRAEGLQRAIKPANLMGRGGQASSATGSAVPAQGSARAPSALSRAGRALPVVRRVLSKGKGIPLVNKKTLKPVLIGLGGAVVIASVMSSGKRRKRKKQAKALELQKVTKPAMSFLVLKTALSVTEPVLKHIVLNKVKNRIRK